MILVCATTAFSLEIIEYQETELVHIEPVATDPDNDTVNFDFSRPLNSSGEWQTTYGDEGEYNISVTATDSQLETVQDFILVIDRKEEPPGIISYSPQKEVIDIEEGSLTRFSVKAKDLNNDPLEYVWKLDGEEVSHDASYLFRAGYESAGSHIVNVAVSDGKTTVKKEWIMHIDNKDRKPLIQNLGWVRINEENKLTILVNVSDPDGDPIELQAENLPEGATFKRGVFTWSPGYDAVQKGSLLANIGDSLNMLSKTYFVKFIAKSNELEDVETVPITVFDVNRPPVINSLSPVIVDEGELINISPDAYDPDGDKVSYRIEGWLDSLKYQTSYDDSGKYIVKITATDGKKESSGKMAIIVNEINRMPYFRDGDIEEAIEKKAKRFELDAVDLDNDEIRYGAENPPGSLEIKGNVVDYTPDYSTVQEQEKNIVNVKFTASDPYSTTEILKLIEVKNSNRPPEIISFSDTYIAYVGEPILFEVNATDPDNDSLAYAWSFGLFENYDAPLRILKIFNETGNRKVTVKITDGFSVVEHSWEVDVIDKGSIKTSSSTIQRIELQDKGLELPLAQKPVIYGTYVVEG